MEAASKKIKLQEETLAKQQERITELLTRALTAEREGRQSAREASTSSQRADDIRVVNNSYKEQIDTLQSQNNTFNSAIVELQDLLADSDRKLAAADAAVPIKVIEKEASKRGRSSWPLYIWDLILEQLVNGTPPSSVNANIVSHVKKFSPTTIIKELPSIWTIRRARTVLLVIVQTLSAYRLAKADKWHQVFTDATSRRQVTFQNLVISIEEDELFK